jgi:hypothetical protein
MNVPTANKDNKNLLFLIDPLLFYNIPYNPAIPIIKNTIDAT